MHQAVLVQKFKALQDLEAPLLDHDEARQPYFPQVLPNAAGGDQFGDQD